MLLKCSLLWTVWTPNPAKLPIFWIISGSRGFKLGKSIPPLCIMIILLNLFPSKAFFTSRKIRTHIALIWQVKQLWMEIHIVASNILPCRKWITTRYILTYFAAIQPTFLLFSQYPKPIAILRLLRIKSFTFPNYHLRC